MLARSFLIKSSGNMPVTRTGVKAQSSSILGLIRPLILELLALEWRKFHTFELEYLWSQWANLDQILCVASLGWGKGCIRFWGRLTLAHWTQVSDRCPLGYLFLWGVLSHSSRNMFLPAFSHSHNVGLWAISWQNQQKDCTQRRLGSAMASAQSDQSLCCVLSG